MLAAGGSQARRQAEPCRAGRPEGHSGVGKRGPAPPRGSSTGSTPLSTSRCGSRTAGLSGAARSVWSQAPGLWQPQGSPRPQDCRLPAPRPCHCPWSPGWARGPPPRQASRASWARARGCSHPSGPMLLVRPSRRASPWRRHPCGCWPRSTHRFWTGLGPQPEWGPASPLVSACPWPPVLEPPPPAGPAGRRAPSQERDGLAWGLGLPVCQTGAGCMVRLRDSEAIVSCAPAPTSPAHARPSQLSPSPQASCSRRNPCFHSVHAPGPVAAPLTQLLCGVGNRGPERPSLQTSLPRTPTDPRTRRPQRATNRV